MNEQEWFEVLAGMDSPAMSAHAERLIARAEAAEQALSAEKAAREKAERNAYKWEVLAKEESSVHKATKNDLHIEMANHAVTRGDLDDCREQLAEANAAIVVRDENAKRRLKDYGECREELANMKAERDAWAAKARSRA